MSLCTIAFCKSKVVRKMTLVLGLAQNLKRPVAINRDEKLANTDENKRPSMDIFDFNSLDNNSRK